jgi:dipeptidyl aminopeptidase/acylaminoacyl peptidase
MAVFAGPVGSPEPVAQSDLFCMHAQPSSDGSEVLWIDWGPNTSPHNLIRLTGIDGNPATGDSEGGATQVWGPATLISGGQAVVAIFSTSSDDGPLWLFDRTTQTQRQLTTEHAIGTIDVSQDERWAVSGYAYELRLFDLETGEMTLPFSFPWEAPECTIDDLDPASECFFHIQWPSFSLDGTKIAFVGRGQFVDRDSDVFVYDLRAQDLTRVTNDEVCNTTPVFDGSGEWLYFERGPCGVGCLQGRCALARTRADGSGSIEVVIPEGIDGLSAVWPRLSS